MHIIDSSTGKSVVGCLKMYTDNGMEISATTMRPAEIAVFGDGDKVPLAIFDATPQGMIDAINFANDYC